MKFSRIITAIDTHSSGEATRIIIGGIPKLPGKTMAEKQAYFQKHFDHLRTALLQEPRGFAGLLGAVITEPTVPEADVGVIYLWTGGYFSACGDSTYSVSAMLVNTGMVEVEEPVTEIVLDTVAGLVRTRVRVVDGEAEEIAMQGTPSFYLKTVKVDVPGVGEVEADIAYGGLWYAFIDAKSLDLVPTKENKDEWIKLGWKIRCYLAEKVPVSSTSSTSSPSTRSRRSPRQTRNTPTSLAPSRPADPPLARPQTPGWRPSTGRGSWRSGRSSSRRASSGPSIRGGSSRRWRLGSIRGSSQRSRPRPT